MNRRAPALVGLLVFLLAACSPSLSPLYRDFTFKGQSAEVLDAEKTARIREALADAGWQLAPSELPGVITTAPKTFSNWGLYKTNLSLEVIGIGDKHVRVFFHPYRSYLTGGRGKIPYLSRGLQEDVLPPLRKAFEAQGLEPVGLAIERERLAAGR